VQAPERPLIRIASLHLVDREGERNRLEGRLAPDVRIQVRRDDVDRDKWHLLATHPLIAAPTAAEPRPEQRNGKPLSQKGRATAAARDLLERSGGRPLDDRVDDIGCAS
jgi:hypothetical protein